MRGQEALESIEFRTALSFASSNALPRASRKGSDERALANSTVGPLVLLEAKYMVD